MKIEIDHQSAVPLHIQVENLLRELIKQPEYQAGKLLPNELELAKKLAVSRTTLRQAINKLVYEELLVRKKRLGTKVAQPKMSSKSMNWLSFTQEMLARGITIKNYELHISWVYPDEQIAAFFDIRTDRKIMKLERLRGNTQEPFVYFISYFHPRIGLTGDEDFKKPLYEMLEQEHYFVATLSKEEISSRTADKMIASKLEIDLGSAILFRKRFVYDQAERPMEYNLGYYKAESFVYTVESRRTP
ncbi:GntR family transcriptional regulator [Chitinophaga oryzae]|uniref:GntR family transcriptional regulator n=1 Tax=Chitinophaga oryzae TaxID=2725414 RepID=A0AAE6ZG02_9BACT|nr:GntR family transcriptional regulator [Chitinophaga oryzae]QJB32288.1 GntR family transcriptional regulator [Chitinophaga oryzae]QJB38749.1 GntR family transcriptional regulator [Chitinophaga oryzae]